MQPKTHHPVRVVLIMTAGLLLIVAGLAAPWLSPASYAQTDGVVSGGGGTLPGGDEVGDAHTNTVPTDINLSNDSVGELHPVGTVVGSFSTIDADNPGDSHAYTLVSGSGDTDNGSFSIDGVQLKTAAVFAFAVQNSYSIRVQSKDSDDETVEKNFIITVIELAAEPTAITLTPASVAENQSVGTVVGLLATVDEDNPFDAHTYSLVAGAGDTDNGSFTVDGATLKTAAAFNFEAKSSYAIRVQSTDLTGKTVETPLTVTVTNVNEAPTDIALAPTTVEENKPTGAIVGSFTTTDPDSVSPFTYALTSGDGAIDNGAFSIDGAQLKTAAVFNYEAKTSYSIRVKSTDSGGLSFDKSFTITITNVNEPPVANPDTFTVGEDSGFTVFSVLNNDTDPENDPRTITGFMDAPHGTVQLINSSTQLQYNPDLNYCNQPGGTPDEFTYKIGPAANQETTVKVTVTCVNDPVVAIDDSALTGQGNPVVVNVLANDRDVDGDLNKATLQVTSGPAHGSTSVNTNTGAITYTPTAGYLGPDSFAYQVCDTACDTATVNLFVSAVDLHLAKDDGGVSAVPGDVITYTLSYSNSGNADAAGVVISDTVPVNTVFVAAASNGVWSCPDGSATGVVCQQTVGALAQNSSGATVLAVRVVDPLAVGAESVSNVASIRDNGANGPELTPDDNRATDMTPIDAEIDLNAAKQDELLVDADANGLASPGDTIRYSVTLTLTGNAPALNVTFADTLDASSNLVVGSVTTTRGAVTDGNNPDDVAVLIALGDLPIGATATLVYDVLVRNPLPAGVDELVNQGVFNGTNVPTIFTDDPDTPQPGDPTRTLLTAKANLAVSKEGALADDNDENGIVSPGDTVQYTITVVSSGNQSVSGVLLKDALDPNVVLLNSSVTPSRGTLLSGAQTGDSVVAVDVGTLTGNGDSAVVTYRVSINNPIAGDVDEIVNQATVSSDTLPDVLSDDPNFDGPQDATRITVNANAKLYLSMVDYFVADVDGNGVLSSGDVLIYRLTLFNNGNRAALNVILENLFDDTALLLPGTVVTSKGTVVAGGTVGSDRVRIEIASLPGGDRATFSYQVRIGSVSGLSAISNQARTSYLNGDKQVELVSDDPDSLVSDDATRSPLGRDDSGANRLYLPIINK